MLDRGVTWTVYALVFPNGKRYIGVTKKGIDVRLGEHLRAAEKGRDVTVCAAIRKYGRDSVRVERLTTCRSEVRAKQLEVHYIRKLGTLRPGGYNATEGGNGVIDPSGLSEAKRLRRMRRTMASEDYKLRQKKIQAEVWTPKKRAEKSKRAAEMWADPEYRAKVVNAHVRPDAKCHRVRKLTHEEKSAICKAVWKRDGHREKMSAAHSACSDEYRRKISDSTRRLMANPEYLAAHSARMREVMNRPEVRARCSAAHGGVR